MSEREQLPIVGRLLAEGLGTAVLLATVVGSGIMGQTLAQGNAAIALLANSLATAAILYVLISVLGALSGAHFNPAVTLAMRWRGALGNGEAVLYILAQLAGAIAGVLLAHAMFEQPLWQPGVQIRNGAAQWLSEGVATAGLVATILLALRWRAEAIPALVASYILAAYWFTASTSFANPAVTVARTLTRSFAGIRPEDAGPFIAAQLLGTALAVALVWLLTPQAAPASRVEAA